MKIFLVSKSQLEWLERQKQEAEQNRKRLVAEEAEKRREFESRFNLACVPPPSLQLQ